MTPAGGMTSHSRTRRSTVSRLVAWILGGVEAPMFVV